MINFFNKILAIKKFKEEYNKIQIVSVQTQLGLDKSYSIKDIDWTYMLTSASVLAQADEGEAQDAALRIAQTCITLHDNVTCKNAAAIILHTLTNNPAIQLAIKRQVLNQDYLSNIPMPLRFDISNRTLNQKIFVEKTKEVNLNRFQLNAYKLFFENDRLSISAPTSAGKSFLLLKLLLDSIAKNGVKEIVYLVPTRALIQQVEHDINSNLKDNGYSDFTVSAVPVLNNKEEDVRIFVFTQERFQWLLNDNPSYIPDVIFIDEAQKIGDDARGIILENVLTEVTSRNQRIKMVFASPMTINPEKLLNYNRSENIKIEKIVGELTSVNQNMIWVHQDLIDTQKWFIDFCVDEESVENIGYVTTDKITGVGNRMPHVAKALSNNSLGNLIYVSGQADAEKVAYKIYDLSLDSEDIVNETKDLIDLITKGIHKDYILNTVLKRGVAFHYGNMPLVVKTEIEDLFKKGIIKYLVCTSTLIEGVNLPAQTIFIRGNNKAKGKPMSEMDFWNLAGRAGRQGKEFQGNIVCIDTDDDNIWHGKPPKKKKRYEIISSAEKILKEHTTEFIAYINEKDTKVLFERQDFAHVLSYLLNEKIKSSKLVESELISKYDAEVLTEVDEAIDVLLASCQISIDILSKNLGIHPYLQQNLLDYFNEKKDKDLYDLIPCVPSAKDAYTNYIKIINRISKQLSGDPVKLSKYRALLVRNWMWGFGLARIISDNIDFWKEEKTVAVIIREAMRDIEEYARFKFLKYVSCYNSILAHSFLLKNKTDLVKQIPNMNLWLEFGASQLTQISLMGLGLSRNTALQISEKYMSNENMTIPECIKWLQNASLESFELNAISKREIEKAMDRYSKKNV